MKGKAFLDTNVLVYCYSSDDPSKQKAAVEVASLPAALISTQVIQELCNILSKKFKLNWKEISKVVVEVEGNFEIHNNASSTIRKACHFAETLKFSFYDSLIVASAIEAECEILFSEDLQDGQVIENQLLVRNPFAKI
jgi:predicted nucleic acid-binding protein